MSRTIIDLTDLESWSGIHGGTQRVVYGIARQYYQQHQKHTQEVVFVSFSQQDKAFHVCDFEIIIQRVETARAAETPGSLVDSMQQRLKRKIKRYVPEKVWRNEALQKRARKSLAMAVRVKQKGARYRRSLERNKRITESELVTIRPKDTVLILGKPWDNPDIQQYLSIQKQSIDYTLVQLIYDLIICLNPHLHHPTLFTVYTQHMFEAIASADMLLPISKSTAADIKTFCERLRLPVPPMKVIRLGDEISNNVPVQSLAQNLRLQQRFILCVGTIEIRKNHNLLYYAYRLAHERDVLLPQLVIVGAKGWLTSDLQYLVEHDPAMKGKIIILDSISDPELEWLYGNCLFTIYPSMYEGWGLPVAESLAKGKACLASNSSSVPEIAGDLIDYISPYDSNVCMNMIKKYDDDTLLKTKEAKIRRAYKITTWTDTYQQVARAVLGKTDR